MMMVVINKINGQRGDRVAFWRVDTNRLLTEENIFGGFFIFMVTYRLKTFHH